MFRTIIPVVALLAAALSPDAANAQERFVAAINEAIACEEDSDAPPLFTGPSCSTSKLHGINPQGRIVWVGATVDLSASYVADPKPLTIYIGALASSEIYWNGELVGANGTPAASRQLELPGNLDAAFFIPPRLLVEGENRIAIKMASFHNPIKVRTPFHYLTVASAEPIRAPFTFYYMPSLLTAAAFVLAAAYFGFMAINNREQSGAVFIALMALFAGAQLWAEAMRAFTIYAYPWQIWRLIAIAVSAAGFSLAMSAYVTRRFQPAKWKFYFAAAALLTPIAVFAPGFDFKAVAALVIPLIVTIISVLRPAFDGINGARLACGALIGFFALVFIDGQNFLDRTFYLAAGALMLVLFVDQARTLRAVKAAKEEMKLRAEQLELELLRRKIAPHFLMNTLNALIEWVESDPKTGVKMIDALADEFRLLSQMSRRAFVPLADEIALCRRHLEVMSYRVDRAYALDTEGVDETIEVPPGIIHTLIENSFTHGQYADGARFMLRQEQAGDQTILTFSTPPAIASRDGETAEGGAGLDYVKKRLAAAFGGAADFSDGRDAEGCWISTLAFESQAS